MKFIIVNGEIINTEETNFTSAYLDTQLMITEKIWFGFGGIPMFKEKTEQITQKLSDFGVTIPDLFLNQREFFRRIKRMLNKNRFYRTGLIKIQILISNSATNFVLFATPFEQTEFIYHEKGVLINISDIHKYSKSPDQVKVELSEYFEFLANAENTDTQVQKTIFLNEKGMVCDAGTANMFFIKKNTLITPALETGCIPDNLRNLILDASRNIGLQINESATISPDLVYKMDEIFIASESAGIQWILGIETKRFVHPVSIKIHKEINEILKKKALN